DAVFGDQESDPQIPYRLADRAVGKENPVAEVLDRVLTLVDSRLTGHALLDLLALRPVQQRFGLDEGHMSLLKDWIRESGIRWGIDATDRERHLQPPYEENTWRFGLDRMLLGVAMPGRGRDTFFGVLPYDEIEGGDADVLGRLADACEALFSAIRQLQTPRSPARWAETIKEVIDRIAAVHDRDSWRVQQVREAVDDIAKEAAGAGHDGPVDLAAMRALLARRLNSPRRAAGFLTGAVTFCAMVPMRSVPFKVVVLLGMDEDTYPRKQRSMGFDLTRRRPRLGDRNTREEDRYLMLEALLAARDALVVTYTARDPQTGEVRAPASPVDELLEVIG
ncbi:MAG: exodeoxyribonuclease V subunit gamma, partial [Myxococcota bacterium]|nr:exodeoxyribonuclease V subunit gamma [Myxococcota bacterium]